LFLKGFRIPFLKGFVRKKKPSAHEGTRKNHRGAGTSVGSSTGSCFRTEDSSVKDPFKGSRQKIKEDPFKGSRQRINASAGAGTGSSQDLKIQMTLEEIKSSPSLFTEMTSCK
jgi:hypothetical protein